MGHDHTTQGPALHPSLCGTLRPFARRTDARLLLHLHVHRRFHPNCGIEPFREYPLRQLASDPFDHGKPNGHRDLSDLTGQLYVDRRTEYRLLIDRATALCPARNKPHRRHPRHDVHRVLRIVRSHCCHPLERLRYRNCPSVRSQRSQRQSEFRRRRRWLSCDCMRRNPRQYHWRISPAMPNGGRRRVRLQ